jgi:hypothetical protein
MTKPTKPAPAGTKRGRLQRACLEILRAHEQQPNGLPTSTRFIYYELIQRGDIAKKPAAGKSGGRRPDQDVAEVVFLLRKNGLVPCEWIVDETRSPDSWRYADSVADYLKDMVSMARLDLWGGEPPPMILTESRLLAGVLRELAAEYLVPIAATNGQCGGFLRTDIAPALEPGQRVIYLGDYDWQGAQIEANTRRVLEDLIGGELDWQRVAITEEQVLNYDLPRIRKPDRRYKPVRHHDAVETEALGQSIIVALVRDHLDDLLPESLTAVRVRGQEQQEKVRASLTRIARRTA